MNNEHLHPEGRPFTKDEFVEKIKTDKNFADRFGDLGRIYGAQWRNWKTITKKWWDDPEYQGYGADTRTGWEYEETQIDQISELIRLLKETPDSRRMVVSAWAVHDLPNMVLPPCHYGFQVYTRELSVVERMEYYGKHFMKETDSKTFEELCQIDYDKLNIPTRAISLMWNQRSVDTFLGLPFNIASYGLLLEIIAKEVNMVADELIGNLGDVHLYSNHIEQAKEQIGRELTFNEFWDSLTPKQKGSMEKPYEGETYNGIDSRIELMNIMSEIHNISTRTRQPFPLPTLNINTEFWKTQSGECGVGPLDTNLQGFEISDFEIDNYQSHPTIKAPLSN